MNTKSVIALATLTLIIGFGAARIIKPGHQRIKDNAQDISSDIKINKKNEIWTCSMHPQIRQDEPGDCPLCGMDLILLEENSSGNPLVLEMTHDAVRLSNIQTSIIGEDNIDSDRSIRLSGKVQADERLSSSQVAHVPGRIEKLYVTFTGEQVYKAQKLAKIYSPELITAQRELLEALKLIHVNPSLVESARNKLRYWKINENAINEIEKNGTVQETFYIYADETGIVTNRRVAVGDHLKEGDPLFEMVNLRKVWVLFDAYEENLSDISVGDKIEFTIRSIPDRIFKTKVTFIDPVINSKTRVASVRTEIANAKGLLKPEMFVSGILSKKGGSSQLSVPKSAVLWTGKRSVVYIKLPNTSIPSFEFREVELGEGLGQSYQIINGLDPGDEVVTYGSFTIDAAAQLNNQTSMMNRNVKIKGVGSELLPDYTEVVPMEFKHQLLKVLDAYLMLKDALVVAVQVDAGSAANQIVKELREVDMSFLEGEAHIYWMKQINAIGNHAENISELNDVEDQRKQFDFLSQSIIKSIKVYGIPEGVIYVEHCPMANDNQGADWLSREKAIRNPYFGDKMLTCGLIQDTITNLFKNPSINQVSKPNRNLHNH